MGSLILGGVIFILVLLVLRCVGAWMLRIDEVIVNQKETNKLLERIYLKSIKDGVVSSESNDNIKLTVDLNIMEEKKLGIIYSNSKIEDFKVKVDEVITGSVCDLSGIEKGDTILSLNGVSILHRQDLTNEIRKIKKSNNLIFNFEIKRN